MYTFTFLEAISLKSRGLQGHALSKGSRVDSVPHLFPVSGGYWHSLVYGLWLRHSSLCLHLHITFSCSTLCISYKDTSLDLSSTQIIWNGLNSRSLLNLQMVPSSKKGNIYRYQELDMNIFIEEETIFFSLHSQHLTSFSTEEYSSQSQCPPYDLTIELGWRVVFTKACPLFVPVLSRLMLSPMCSHQEEIILLDR